MAEPLEETRSTLSFATEPITASLRHAISASTNASTSSNRKTSREEEELELDEVEIQKGLSQLAKGLEFLHGSAKLVHGNLNGDSVVINAKGDWKLAGFGLSKYLFGPDGVPAKWEFPGHDHSTAASCQRDYDYIAPEYILDESAPAPANDLYSLGCLLHAIHTKSGPPFSNHDSLERARTNIEEGLSRGMIRPAWRKLPDEIQSVLSQLVTRYPSSRLSASNFLTHSYFSSLLVSTLRYLERDSFAGQTLEAQTGFLKGLISVLPRFSDKVNRRKVLPALLEETRKAGLVPFLLPNILFIGGKMEPDMFREEVLPELKPLFALKDPPQAVVALLDNLPIFAEKCTPAVFRDEVMPLIYHALESENPQVLEKALRVVPGLSETLDYTTVKQILFPKITAVFSKTTMLSVKVNTLICFHSMIKTLDKFTLTEKLVPLLAKIKTKEPSVMVATLAVHEEMGKKCEIEAIATLILPQLWSLSVGPLLNADQFAKFMSVIKKLGARVEAEHSKQLAELKRLEESSSSSAGRMNGNGGGVGMTGGSIDFESLVRGGVGVGKKEVVQDLWADDSPSASRSVTPNPYAAQIASTPIPTLAPNRPPAFSSNSSSSTPRAASNLGARIIPPLSFNSDAFPSTSSSNTVSTTQQGMYGAPLMPTSSSGLGSFAALQPSNSSAKGKPPLSSNLSGYGTGRPNYNLSTTTTNSPMSTYQSPPSSNYQNPSMQTPQTSTLPPPLSFSQAPPSRPMSTPQASSKPTWNVVPPLPPPGFGGGVLVPTVVDRKVNGGAKAGFGDWADLDPLN